VGQQFHMPGGLRVELGLAAGSEGIALGKVGTCDGLPPADFRVQQLLQGVGDQLH